MRRLVLLPCSWVICLLGESTSAAAQPAVTPESSAPQPEPTRSPALDAALGTPPSGYDPSLTPPGQGTFNAGFTEGQTQRNIDQTYGSTATTVAPDGSLVSGLTLTDPGLLPSDDGYPQIPEYHVVQRGDTLWDISELYLRDPYLWPKLWSWNDHVTNAHWIFPGDRIRLYDPFAPQIEPEAGPSLSFSKTRLPGDVRQGPYVLTQTAFVDAAQFETDMTVIGGGDAKVMMSTLDTVYLSYQASHPPIPGERLTIYSPQKKVYDVKGKNVLGYVVQVVGEVDIESLARKAAEGMVDNAIHPVERGYKVGPLRRRFRRLDPLPSDRSAVGQVVASMTSTGPIPVRTKQPKEVRGEDVLAGGEQFVIVDLGQGDGVQVGHVLEVVRKGDAYTKKRVFKLPYEEGWPRRVIGALLVVEVLQQTSLAVAIYSRQEFERGDHVELRKPGVDRAGDPQADAARGQAQADADGQVERGDGSVKAKGGFSMGN